MQADTEATFRGLTGNKVMLTLLWVPTRCIKRP